MRVFKVLLLAVLWTGCLPLVAMSAELPKLGEPVLYTSLGQSPDGRTVSVLGGRADLVGEFVPLAGASEVAAVKTVFVTVGTSLKGFGSAGVNLDSEMARAETLAKAAKDAGTYLVLVHIGGAGRRDAMSNQLLDKLGPHADAFLVYAAGNEDGYFEKAAGNKPLVLVPKTAELVGILKAAKL